MAFKLPLALEAKLSDNNLENNFSIFKKITGPVPKFLVVKKLNKRTTLADGTKVVAAHTWLTEMKW